MFSTYSLYATDTITSQIFYDFASYHLQSSRAAEKSYDFGFLGSANISVVGSEYRDVNTYDSFKLLTFLDDFYNRIEIVPSSLDLGNISSVSSTKIKITNYFLDQSAVLSSLESPVNQGISLTLFSYPIDIKTLASVEYDLSVSAVGPASISANVVFVIDGVDYSLSVSGQRTVLWPIEPNWSSFYTETYNYVTSISTSEGGDETRRSLADLPGKQISYFSTVTNENSSFIKNLLYAWQDRIFSLPVWADKTYLLQPSLQGSTVLFFNTENLSFFEGQDAILFRDKFDFEIVKMVSISEGSVSVRNELSNDWHEGSAILPVNFCFSPNTARATYVTSKVGSAQLSFEVDVSESDPITTETFDFDDIEGFDLYAKKPNFANPVTFDSTSDYQVFRNAYGKFSQVSSVAENFPLFEYSLTLKSRQEIAEFKKFLNSVKGRFKPFYMSSYKHDYDLARDVQSGESNLIVKRLDVETLLQGSEIHKGLHVLYKDGTEHHSLITGFSAFSSESDTVSIANGVPQDASVSEISRISLVYLFRLASDSVTISYYNSEIATVTLRVRAVKS